MRSTASSTSAIDSTRGLPVSMRHDGGHLHARARGCASAAARMSVQRSATGIARQSRCASAATRDRLVRRARRGASRARLAVASARLGSARELAAVGARRFRRRHGAGGRARPPARRRAQRSKAASSSGGARAAGVRQPGRHDAFYRAAVAGPPASCGTSIASAPMMAAWRSHSVAPSRTRGAALGVRTEFPRHVRRIDHTWIPLGDGTRLAARIWLPEDAESDPVPALLEFLPYRKGDAMARRDSRPPPVLRRPRLRRRARRPARQRRLRRHPRRRVPAAGGGRRARGASRGSRRSRGAPGRVGMFGISWGGFNSLQVAARRPPALGASISMCASDDRYADDVHYIGGCVLGLDMLPWAADDARRCSPSRPTRRPSATAGARRGSAAWSARPAFVEPWLAHQRRDDYWRHGSVCEDYARDRDPRLRDRRLGRRVHERDPAAARGLPGPRKGLIGPWSHAFPQDGEPGPAIGFLQECLRWWDHWLKGVDTGVMDEPMLRAWIRSPSRPAGHHAERPGRWVAESAWPSPRSSRAHGCSPATACSRAADAAAAEAPLATAAPRRPARTRAPGAPTAAPATGPSTSAPRTAARSRSRPRRSTSRSRSWASRRSCSTVAADRPRALVAVRLCDVAPDGSSLLVTRGLLNLTHREGHDATAPLEPGRALRRARPARRDRPARPRRPPPARRDLDRVLAVGVAVAGAGRRSPSSPGRRAGSSCPSAPPRDADAALPPFGEPEWSEPLEPGGAALGPDEPHPRARPRRAARTSSTFRVGRRRPPAARRRRPRARRHEPHDATASSRAIRCRRACAAAASRRSRAGTGTPGSRPTAT